MKPKPQIITGALIFITGILFSFIETIYFLITKGFHFLPCNYTEAICDYISLIMVMVGGLFMVIGVAKLINEEVNEL